MPAVLVAIGLAELAIAVLLFERWRALAEPEPHAPREPFWRRRRPEPEERPLPKHPRFRLAGEAMRITLDLEVDDPEHPTVRRMVREAAAQAMDRDPTAHEVAVHDRRGVVLGRVSRPEPLPGRTPEAPAANAGPSMRPRTRTPQVVRAPHSTPAVPRSDDVDAADLHVEGRPLAQRFDLPPAVLARLHNEEDAVELVRAILDAAGLRPKVRGDVIDCGNRAVVVIGPHTSHGSTHDALSRAYLRFVDSGASNGLCITFATLDPTEVRRRELLAPSLRHVPMSGIQHMADAVALGVDPLKFAAGPVLVNG